MIPVSMMIYTCKLSREVYRPWYVVRHQRSSFEAFCPNKKILSSQWEMKMNCFKPLKMPKENVPTWSCRVLCPSFSQRSYCFSIHNPELGFIFANLVRKIWRQRQQKSQKMKIHIGQEDLTAASTEVREDEIHIVYLRLRLLLTLPSNLPDQICTKPESKPVEVWDWNCRVCVQFV